MKRDDMSNFLNMIVNGTIRVSVVLIVLLIFATSCNNINYEKEHFYIGTYTDGSSKGIYFSSINPENGKIDSPILAYEMKNPSFLTISICGDYLFAVSEKDDTNADLFSFKINHSSGELYLIDSISTNGRGACYVEELKDGLVGVAHYNSGDVAFVLHKNGVFEEENIQQFIFEGGSINESRQETSHIHCVVADNQNQFAYVADLGRDKIEIFDIQSNIIKHIDNFSTELGAGPRLVAFHPHNNQMAVINELNGTLSFYEKDSNSLFIKPIKDIKLSESRTDSWAADVKFTSQGKNIYASERADNKIYVFAVNDYEVGRLGEVTEEINVPRSFVLTEDDNYLIIANQEGGSLVSYSLEKNGVVGKLLNKVEVDKPVSIVFKNK